MSNISFRSSIQGELLDFCKTENFTCALTVSALCDLVTLLAAYQEEGAELLPEVYLCKSIEKVTAMLHMPTIIYIGTGEINSDSIRKGIKKCAPLSQSEWSVFFEANSGSNTLNYGVFSYSKTPLSLHPTTILTDSEDTNTDVIYTHKFSPGSIIIKGSRGTKATINFLQIEQNIKINESHIDNICAAISEDVDIKIRENTRSFLLNTLTKALEQCHGSLIAVLPSTKKTLHRSMQDGVILAEPINIPESIQRYLIDKSPESMSALQGISSLLQGMIQCDGIVLFKSDGSIVGYNLFISKTSNIAPPEGGARLRAYEQICGLIPNHVKAALFKSHDGDIRFSPEGDQ